MSVLAVLPQLLQLQLLLHLLHLQYLLLLASVVGRAAANAGAWGTGARTRAVADACTIAANFITFLIFLVLLR